MLSLPLSTLEWRVTEMPSRRNESSEEESIVDEELAQPVGKSIVIAGKTYYANEDDEIIIRISDKEGPADETSNDEPTIWNTNSRHKCCVCLEGRIAGNKLMQCGHPKGCVRNFHKDCGSAVGCLLYGSESKLECPVHYQSWQKGGVRFKYAGHTRVTNFDRVVAEVRSLLSEETWNIEDRLIWGEVNMGVIQGLLLLGKYKQQVTDREFLLLVRDVVNKTFEVVLDASDAQEAKEAKEAEGRNSQ